MIIKICGIKNVENLLCCEANNVDFYGMIFYKKSSRNISIKEAKQLAGNGAKEITLLGQNVNAYNFEGKKLSDLIFEISKINDLKRIRYTTSHPKDFTQDLIDAHKNCEKLMPLIHLPVQSGSNKILEAMNRKHTIEEYLGIVENLNKVNPSIRFSSDFIENMQDLHSKS